MTSRNTTENLDQYDFPDPELLGSPTAQTVLAQPEEAIADKPTNVDDIIAGGDNENIGGGGGGGGAASPSKQPILWWERDPGAANVPSAPLYVHEKIQPLQFIESLLKSGGSQSDMFDSFNNLPEGAHYEPYVHHGGNWSNRLIRTSGQRAMRSLLDNEGMGGQVDLVYVDPPYNISFRSNFQGAMDDTAVGEKWEDLPQDVRPIKAFRDSYSNGVHSYLDQLRTQFILAREMLAESGSIIVQIGPDNLHFVTIVLSEVFGHENHVATIPYTVATNSSTKMLPEIGNWLVWFAKDKAQTKYRQLYENMSLRDKTALMNTRASILLSDGSVRRASKQEVNAPETVPAKARWLQTTTLVSSHESTTGRSDPWEYDPERYPNRPPHYPDRANAYPCPAGRHWRVSLDGLRAIAAQGRMFFQDSGDIEFIRYADEMPGRTLNSIWTNIGAPMNKEYIVETPPTVLERSLLMTTDPGDLILDLTCGSGAMPLQAEKWGRRWIAVDVSAVAIAIARERLLATIHDYHLLKDSPEGHKRDHELERALLPPEKRTPFVPKARYGRNPAAGFVNARQMRVSAATLAYGPKEDGSDVIRHPDRVERDPKRKRAASAFRVESDLPYTAKSPDETFDDVDMYTDVVERMERSLETAGITVPGGQGEPDWKWRARGLERVLGDYGNAVTHRGELVDEDGEASEALFYICRDDEVATEVIARNLRLAAMRETEGQACAVLIFFSHEGLQPGATGVARIREIRAIANLDHVIPDLKASRSDSAFTLISEPEIEIHEEADGRISLEVKDLAVYNPRSGQVEPADSRKIAGIMTDTDYDHESFRARLVNLPRDGKAAERRMAQIRASFKRDIDADQWERMRSLRTLPFDRPESGTVAVKVIDHTGLEHLQTLRV